MDKFRQIFQNVKKDEGYVDSKSYKDSFDGAVDYDIKFPSVSLEMIDTALLSWFNEQYPIVVTKRFNERKQVKAIPSTFERWAMVRLNKDLRDSNGQINLPVISIKRNDVNAIQDRIVPVDKDGTTNIRLYVHEYINGATQKKEYYADYVKTSRGKISTVVEVIEIQPPKMLSISYGATFWSDYMEDMNEAIEHMERNFGNRHSIYVDENLFFHARLEQTANVSNDESIENQQRIFKSVFSIIVEAPFIDEESIRRRRTINSVDIDVKFDKELVLNKEKSDLIRENVQWYGLDSIYRLKR